METNNTQKNPDDEEIRELTYDQAVQELKKALEEGGMDSKQRDVLKMLSPDKNES